MGLQHWSTTAADNDDADAAINWAEGQAPSTVNNSARAMMAAHAAYRNLIGGAVTTGGSANTHTLVSGLTFTAYQNGVLMGFEAGFTNTDTATLNVDSLGAKTLKTQNGQNLGPGAIVAGSVYHCVYESGADVIVVLNANIVGKHTIWVPASAMIPATTNGPASAFVEAATNDQNYKTLDFDATTDEFAHFQIAMPKSWNEGTVTYQVWWTSTATDTDGVAWSLEGVAFGDSDAIDTAWGTAVEVVDNAQSTAGDVYVSAESAAVTIAGTPAAADVCFFRFSRNPDNASDGHAEDARLIGIKLFITLDAPNDI